MFYILGVLFGCFFTIVNIHLFNKYCE